MPTALAISRIVYLPSLLIISLTFETFVLPDAVTCLPNLLHLKQTLSQYEISFSTYELSQRYVMGSIKFPQFNKNLLYRMNKFCANFLKYSNFFNILNKFSNHFYNSGQLK